MDITTTNEAGTTPVRNVKLGGFLAKVNDKECDMTSLADDVTL